MEEKYDVNIVYEISYQISQTEFRSEIIVAKFSSEDKIGDIFKSLDGQTIIGNIKIMK